MGGLAKIRCEGISTLKKLNCIFLLSFSQFNKLLYGLCFHMSLLLYRSIVFLKIERGQIIYLHIFFLYLEDDVFLTLFRITVVLITYVTQVYEFCFTVSIVSFFSLYLSFSFYVYM